MKNFIRTIKVSLFFLLTIAVNGQIEQKDFSAEIVILKNQNLVNFIDSIGLSKFYLKDSQIWYIDFRKTDFIKLASMKKTKLFQPHTDVYLTMIDDKVIFILSRKNDLLPAIKTGFKVDLSKYNFFDLTFELSSYWILKEANGKIEIVDQSIYDRK